MKRTLSNKIITCIATSAVLTAGSLSFTAINAIADEAVSYYGLSADGTVISGTVTDYTKMTSSDTAWGIAGKETWYVADGIVNIITTTYDYDNYKNVYNPVEIKGNVNVILKNGAEVSVVNGIAGTDATITFYSESESASGVIGFIGAYGDDGGWGSTDSGSDKANGKSGEDGKVAVNVSSFTVAGGTVTVIGGNGGKGGDAGYNTDYDTNEKYYGIGGDGGNGSAAITDNTKVYLNGGRLNVTAGRGGNSGTNIYVPSEQQDNYKGKPGNNGTSVRGIYAVNGTLNVNKLDDSDEGDTSGDFKLLSVNGYENAKLDIIGKGTSKVTDGTVIETYGDILVSGSLSVDGGMILTNGDIIKATGKADITKTNGGVIRRITPVAEEGYTLDNANGLCVPEYDYNILLSDGTLTYGFVGASTIVSEGNRLNVVRRGDGDIIDNSEPFENIMPYCFRVNDAPNTSFIGGSVFVEAGTNSSIKFVLNDPDEYCFSGVTVTDWDGNTVTTDKYTFDKQTGVFTALSVDRNMKVTANAKLKDVEIAVTDKDGNAVTSYDFGTGTDNGKMLVSGDLKVKVTDGGYITKYKVVKESDLDKNTGETTGNTSSFSVFYKNYDSQFWGVSDLSQNDKIGVGDSATFRLSVKSGTKAGTYSETYIVITDRSEYADGDSVTEEKAVARLTVTYRVEHENDNLLHYSDLTGHYNECINCGEALNKTNHTFDIKTVNDDTFAKAATCTQPAKYYYSCECGAHSDSLTFDVGEPNGHSFGDWTESKSATCVAGGQKARKCGVCGYTEYDSTDVNPEGHVWNKDFTIDKEPTCTTEGSKSIHCSLCDATKDSTVIPVTEHTYGEWKTVTPSTCTENGVKKHACIRCGFEQTGIIDAAHDWENTRTIDIMPSCTEYGEDSIHCRNCDARTDIEELSPEGHDWSEWETLVEPTKTSEGKAYRFCYTCGIKEEKTLDKLTDETDWQYDDKKHWHKDNDGNIIDLDDHEFKWVVDKEPTATEPGIGHYECISCAFEQAPEEFGKRNPETGSESLVLWGATALIAGTTATITLRMRKKKNK